MNLQISLAKLESRVSVGVVVRFRNWAVALVAEVRRRNVATLTIAMVMGFGVYD